MLASSNYLESDWNHFFQFVFQLNFLASCKSKQPNPMLQEWNIGFSNSMTYVLIIQLETPILQVVTIFILAS